MQVAVYGASGFTGGLVIAELARRGIRTVLVGRDAERLRDAAERAGLADARPRVAALDDPAALAEAFRGCDVVISCVTPFVRFGEPIVRAAIDAGCHYVDITGEQVFIKRVFDAYAADAARAGVTVLPAMTDDGLPGDLIAHLVAQEVAPAEEVTVADLRVPSGASRGTARMALENIDILTDNALIYRDGRWRSDLPVNRDRIPLPDDPTGTAAVVKFALPGTITVPRHVPARLVQGVITEDAAKAFTSITADLVERMPEGPVRRAGRWMMAAHATGHDGRQTTGRVWGTDPYGTTAVIAVEGAHHLATTGAEPGVLAPAQAVDPETFLDRLADYGVQWSTESA